jgi:hypothetical protein
MYTEIRIKKQQPHLFSWFQSTIRQRELAMEMTLLSKEDGQHRYWLNAYAFWDFEVNKARKLLLQRHY